MRRAARQTAEDAYRAALDGVFGLINQRISWRRANAQLLALEAQAMVGALQLAPKRTPFRRWRIRVWKARARRHGARAWAQDQVLSAACGVRVG